MTRSELLTLAGAAVSAGEPSFTFGRLHAREEARAEQLTSAYWASDPTKKLKAHTRKARRAIQDA